MLHVCAGKGHVVILFSAYLLATLFRVKRGFYSYSVEFLYGFLGKYRDLLNCRSSRPLWPRLSRPLLERQTWISPTIQLITPVSVQLWLESTVAYPGNFRGTKNNCTHLDRSKLFIRVVLPVLVQLSAEEDPQGRNVLIECCLPATIKVD